MAGNVTKGHAEAFVVSDYKGETIQVFVFFQGKFLGYQCFGQDRITIGGAPGMDLCLPDCPESEGYWDVYVSRGGLYVWFRGTASSEQAEGPGDPRKVQPLDSFSLGKYRLQVKLLEAQGLVQPSADVEEDLPVEREAASPKEAGEPDESVALLDQEEQEACSPEEPGEEKASGEEPAPELPNEVEGISIDYARSIWATAEEPLPSLALDAEEDLSPDEEARGPDGTNEWIGFGLQEEEQALMPPAGEEAQEEAVEIGPAGDEAETEKPSEDGVLALNDEVAPSDLPGRSADLQESVSSEKESDDEPSRQPPPGGEPGGAAEGMSREEKTRFRDDMAKEAFANRDGDAERADRQQVPVAASPEEELPADVVGEPPSAEEDVLADQEPTWASEPAFASEPIERTNAAVAIDHAETEEEEEGEVSWEEEDDEEEEQDISYFSLVKEVFPNRPQESKTPHGNRRALEVVRFRGRDIQDIRYLESGDSYTIRKGWNRSVWKRRGGVPPNFRLVRLKNGGSAELHLRESVNGRIYSDEGSRDVWELRGGKKARFGLTRKTTWLPLPADTWAVLRVNSGRYLVRYVSPRPKPAVQPLRPNLSAGQFKLVSLSMLSHILLILVIGLAVPDRTLEGYSRIDRFARIDPHALKALQPPPPPKKIEKPKPVAKKTTKPKPTAAAKQPAPKTAQRSTVPTKGKASPGPAKKEVDVAQTGLLAALGGPDAGVLDAKGNSAILLAAVTNLDAVAVPSDTTTFNLAGVAGKLATSEIQVPTSDVIETVGAAQLIKNGDGTLGALASKGSGEVRGIVHEPPKAKISIRGGMSREAVLKVVNAHLDEIRDCYERELLHNPGISGKILMEWLIQLDGSVRYAKVKFTNIGHSSDLHSCIQAQVVTWNFPRPKGGEEVMVTFPFLFESMGF